MELDNTDKKLVTLLQHDCKKTTKQYAQQLNLSTTAVYERIRRLEREGVVTDYVALVDKKKVQRDFTVLCHVRLAQHTKENVLQFENQIKQLHEISECFHVSGDYDYILKINIGNMEQYRDFMVSKLTAINVIGNTQSSFIINEVKHTTAIHI